MNLDQLKRNNLEQDNNAKYFAENIMRTNFNFGPGGLSKLLTEAFLSADESFSAQAWFATIAFLSKYNLEFTDRSFSDEVFGKNQWVKAYTRLIKKLFESFSKKEIILAFYINHRKWSKIIMGELDSKCKASIYAIDTYFAKRLDKVGYKSMNNLLKEESLKVKSMTAAYYSFIDGENE